MGNKLIIIVVAGLFSALLQFNFVFSFVISPSQIDVPTLTNGSTFTTDIISDTELELLRTNCTSVSITFLENVLVMSTSSFSTSNIESCVISVYESEKPSVSFDFEIFVRIQSALFANMTITYDESHLVIENSGNGHGKLFVKSDTELISCELNPGESCNYEPNGLIIVCSDLECKEELFSHDFKTKKISKNNIESSSQVYETKIWLWVVICGVLLIILLAGLLYYFTRRNDTLLKDAS